MGTPNVWSYSLLAVANSPSPHPKRGSKNVPPAARIRPALLAIQQVQASSASNTAIDQEKESATVSATWTCQPATGPELGLVSGDADAGDDLGGADR